VSTGLCIVNGNLCNAFDRGSSVDGAVVMQKTTMAMICVLAQANIAGDVD
jgi:hypothetical protein